MAQMNEDLKRIHLRHFSYAHMRFLICTFETPYFSYAHMAQKRKAFSFHFSTHPLMRNGVSYVHMKKVPFIIYMYISRRLLHVASSMNYTYTYHTSITCRLLLIAWVCAPSQGSLLVCVCVIHRTVVYWSLFA